MTTEEQKATAVLGWVGCLTVVAIHVFGVAFGLWQLSDATFYLPFAFFAMNYLALLYMQGQGKL